MRFSESNLLFLVSKGYWIWYATAHFPPFIRQVGGVFGKMGAHYQLRYVRNKAKKILGEDPDFDNI